jgi:hypothetical protein
VNWSPLEHGKQKKANTKKGARKGQLTLDITNDEIQKDKMYNKDEKRVR